MLHECGDPPTTEALDIFLASSEAEQSRDGYYVGWNRFMEFVEDKFGIAISSPSLRSDRRASRTPYELPPQVADDLIELVAASRMKVSLLPLLRRKHVRPVARSTSYEIDDPTAPGYFYTAPKAVIDRLLAWHEKDILVPIPIKPLRRLLAKRKRSR
jgi:hypothetical protein